MDRYFPMHEGVKRRKPLDALSYLRYHELKMKDPTFYEIYWKWLDEIIEGKLDWK